KWHFQVTHHDLWDYDLPSPTALIDINVKGEKIPALIAVPKHAHMYILNRATGKPVFGVEERPVPVSDVPGEQSSLTQPFPLKPPVLARDSYRPEDIVAAADTSEEHARFCRDLAERSEVSIMPDRSRPICIGKKAQSQDRRSSFPDLLEALTG